MEEYDLKCLSAHALLTGFAQNGHLLTANSSGEDIGEMIGNRAGAIAAGFVRTCDESDTRRDSQEEGEEGS